EERFRRLSNSMPQIVWTAAPDGQATYFNDQWFEYTGRSVEESLGVGWLGALHPDDLARAVSLWEQSWTTGAPYEVEYRFHHTDAKKVEFALELQRRYPPDPEAPKGAYHVARTAKPELVAEISDEMIAAAAADELHLRLLRELGLISYICVPMIARDRVLGVI